MATEYLTPWGWDSEPIKLEIVSAWGELFGLLPHVTYIKGAIGACDGPCDLFIRCLYSSQINHLINCKGGYLVKVTINRRINLYCPREVNILGDDTEDTPIVEMTLVDGGGFVYGTPMPLNFPVTKANGSTMMQKLMSEKLGMTLEPRRYFFEVFLPEWDESPEFWSGENQESNSIGDMVRLSLASRGFYFTVTPGHEGRWMIRVQVLKFPEKPTYTISRGNGDIKSWRLRTFGSQAKEMVADVGNQSHISIQTPKFLWASGWEHRGKAVQTSSANVDAYFDSLQESSQLEVELNPSAPFAIGPKSLSNMQTIWEGHTVEVDLGIPGLKQTLRVMRVEFEQTPERFTMTPVLSQPDKSPRGVWNQLSKQGKEIDFIRAMSR